MSAAEREEVVAKIRDWQRLEGRSAFEGGADVAITLALEVLKSNPSPKGWRARKVLAGTAKIGAAWVRELRAAVEEAQPHVQELDDQTTGQTASSLATKERGGRRRMVL